jgi:hypothetical protein
MKEPGSVTKALLAASLLLLLRRATDKLDHDLESGAEVKSVLVNRVLYDRSTR